MLAVLRVALPLVLASSGHAVRLFTDRVMLSRYSPEAIAAAMPGGLTCFTLVSFFIGIAGYTSVFVAQYTGAGRPERVGLSVWQGFCIAAAGGLAVALLGLAAGPIFAWMGHAPDVQAEEVRYFRVLARFGFVPIMTAALNAFWSGRSRTRVVMGLELLAAGLNVALNRLLIFGGWGCPRLGIYGAGLATGLSGLAALAVGLALFLAPRNRRAYGTWPARRFDPGLLRRLVRFGLPNGVQFLLDMAAFNLFVVFLGQAGRDALEAANQAFGINALAFIPILGFGMTASILVGQAIGARDIPAAQRAVRAAVAWALIYMAAMGVLFTCFPHAILAVYRRPGDPGQAAVLAMAARNLRYITAYLLFDALFVVYSNAIKGAGDTRFTMAAIAVLSWGTLVLPCWLARRAGASVWVLWRLFVAHVVLCGAVFYLRYRAGRWQTLRVVEEHAAIEPVS